MNATTDFTLRGEHITLDALLKATGLASSGGEAKQHITAAAVRVNGEVERRRGRKLRPGDMVQMGDHSVQLQGAVTQL
jgi:ribosome-associated protein